MFGRWYNNFLSSNDTKTKIWQQIHLNFYTQYSYNKWHKTNNVCPLCLSLPESIYHIILHCKFSNEMWENISTTLHKLHPGNVTDEEKAFGIMTKKQLTGIYLRNWLTYLMRDQILKEERIAYNTSTQPCTNNVKLKFNNRIEFEINKKYWRYK